MTQQIVVIRSSLNDFIVSHNTFVGTQTQHNKGVAHILYSMGRHFGMSMDDWPMEDPTHDPVDDINFDPSANQDIIGNDDSHYGHPRLGEFKVSRMWRTKR